MKYNTLRLGDRIGPRLQAYFLQNNCNYMAIIYTVHETQCLVFNYHVVTVVLEK
jgi:hypothetical protein